MQDRYKMTREQNIFVAKRNIVDYIYRSAKLERINVTFPATQAIYDGMCVNGIKVADVIKINNIKRAWYYLLDTLDTPNNFDYLCRINMIIGGDGSIYGAGKVRAYDVKITGTWQPQIPDKYNVIQEMMNILTVSNTTERSIMLMLWVMRRQIFIDGNKRTAMLVANKEMIVGGAGIISISAELIEQFYTLLLSYYETGDMIKISNFIYNNCIDGINFD